MAVAELSKLDAAVKAFKGTSMNAKFTLDVLLNWPIRQSILLVGDHGVGKDGIIQTAAMIKRVPLVDIRLSQNDVGDIKGLPWLVKGRTMFAPPDWMPFEDDVALGPEEMMDRISSAAERAKCPEGYLFFNEVNRGTREAQQCVFEVILDRTMGTRALRKGWHLVSAVNGDEHYQVTVMDVAFKSRFFIINFKPTVEEWLEWAFANDIHPVVTGFVQKHPNLLDPSEEMLSRAETDTALQVQNRRAWHMFSDCIKEREDLAAKGTVPMPISKDADALGWLLLVGYGYVGPLASTEFMNYVAHDYESLSGEIILNKWDMAVYAKVKTIVDGGRVTEISRYNEMVVTVAKNAGKNLSSAQKKNLTAYYKLLTMEMRAHLWKHFMDSAKVACLDWYESKEAQTLVVEALKTPGK
jgi:hypothetical protein